MTVNRYLHRLPLILEILDEINENGEQDYTGDHEIRIGAVQAVTVMINRLKLLDEPTPRHGNREPTDAEMIASEWLLGAKPQKLLPPAIYNELTMLVQKLVPTARDRHCHRGGNVTASFT